MKNQKFLIISILVAAVLIAGSIFYHAYVVKNTNPSTTENSIDAAKQIAPKDIVLGSDKAPVTIVEYSSFTCPNCANFANDTFPILKKDYIDTGKVKFVLRVFPPELAKAAMCYSDKDKFFSFTDYIFKNAADVFSGIENVKTEEEFITLEKKAAEKIATALKFDTSVLENCYNDESFNTLMSKWETDFSSVNKENTVPTFVINNEIIIGNQPYANFTSIIEKYLKK